MFCASTIDVLYVLTAALSKLLHTGRQADMEVGKQPDRKADRQADRQVNSRQTNRQKDRQIDRQTVDK
jgi:hypothetical protein